MSGCKSWALGGPHTSGKQTARNHVMPLIHVIACDPLIAQLLRLRDGERSQNSSRDLDQQCPYKQGHIARFSVTPHSPSKLGSLPQQVRSSSVFGCLVAGIHTPLHAMVHGREVQSPRFHCGTAVGAGSVAAYHPWRKPCTWDSGICLYAGLLGLWGVGLRAVKKQSGSQLWWKGADGPAFACSECNKQGKGSNDGRSGGCNGTPQHVSNNLSLGFANETQHSSNKKQQPTFAVYACSCEQYGIYQICSGI